ncbi:MAG: hypothetical protein U5K75_05525, partial [Ahrensia sp.]|nr:hypothetical protein [Ahrensia sp.]
YFAATAKIVGGTLEIKNTGSAPIQVRYIVFNQSKPNSAIGLSANIFVNKSDANRDYIQILKPNSAAPNPNIDDILLDTRFSYLPIVANGTWSVDVTSNSPTFDIPLNLDSGWAPYPILIAQYENVLGGGQNTFIYGAPQSRRVFGLGASWSGQYTSDTCFAQILSDKVVLRAFPRNITRVNLLDGANGTATFNIIYGHSGGKRVKSVRYYILAIPT